MSGLRVDFQPAVDPDVVPDDGARRVGIATFGCKVNQYESELIAQVFRGDDWQTVPASEEADLYLINTCTVTAEADRQARQAVRRAVRLNPEARVIVTGCLAETNPEAVKAIPGVDWVVSNRHKLDIPARLPDWQSGRLDDLLAAPGGNEDVPHQIGLPGEMLAGYEGRHRAFLLIQQGCDQGCTFCIIHRARGKAQSLDADAIVQQAERLLFAGYRELVLCGVDLGFWGEDLGLSAPQSGEGLVVLIDRLEALAGDYDFRLRLGSLDPAHLSDALIVRFAESRILCPHLHLSLQSGSTLILKRMKRRYDRETMIERVSALQTARPYLVVSADVLVGFPTEDETHFLDTLSMVESLPVLFAHVFPYSERSGTPAARIPRQVPMAERKARVARVRAASQDAVARRLQGEVGSRQRVLIEAITDGVASGRSDGYLPVEMPAAGLATGALVDVSVRSSQGDKLIAVPVSAD